MHRLFILSVLCIIPCLLKSQNESFVMTVNGPVSTTKMGRTLMHEHILLGKTALDPADHHWDRELVINRVLPYLLEIKDNCRTFVDCTPVYIGRDPLLLKALSDASGINILTNTGYYGTDNALPPHAYTESADEIAEHWISEWENGIGSTGIKPGFIKISVGTGKLSEMHTKLITAAAKAHLKTGLVILSHTGPSIPAFEQIEVLQKEGVAPEAFIWTHAQNENNPDIHAKAAKAGAWVALDGLSDNNVDEYVQMILSLKERDVLNRILISHDAGWYTLEVENGGDFRGYTTLFKKLIPLLKAHQVSEKEINQLLVINPAQAFEIKIRK